MIPYNRSPASATEPIRSFWRHRTLISQLTKREIVGRYRGSLLGLAWSFLHPILMLAVYTFVFSVVFKARWGIGSEETKATFAIVLFVGLIVHGLFAEVTNRAPGLVLSNVTYVKRVVFPLEVLPWVTMGSALFHTAISLFVLLIAQLVLTQQFHLTSFLFPILALPLFLATMGLAWFLAATGVYLRDIGHVVGIVTTVMLFLAPVFYPISALPEPYRPILYLNPLTFVIEEGRRVLLSGDLPDWGGWAVYLGISVFLAWAGFSWFQKARKGFADVL
jgi:lipopolysaccharide transport system permease protein